MKWTHSNTPQVRFKCSICIAPLTSNQRERNGREDKFQIIFIFIQTRYFSVTNSSKCDWNFETNNEFIISGYTLASRVIMLHFYMLGHYA